MKISMFPIIGLCLIGILPACHVSSQNSSTAVTATASTAKTTKTTSGTATTLSISSGSASGTEVTLPADAVAAGTSVSLAQSTVPVEFSSLPYSAASAPISLSGKDASGAAVSKLTHPMTLSISVSSSALTLAVEKTNANICVLLKTLATDRFVWRNAQLTIASGKVRFTSIYMGIYQVVYCGAESVMGFSEADESVTDELRQFDVTIDSGMYGYGATQYCIGVVASQKNNFQSLGTTTQVPDQTLYATQADITGGLVTVSITVPVSKVDLSVSDVYLGFVASPASTTCSFAAGSVFAQFPPYIRVLGFKLSADNLAKNTNLAGTVGTGAYGLVRKYLKAGMPIGANVQDQLPATPKTICVRGDSQEKAGASFAALPLTSTGFTEGSAIILDIPTYGDITKTELELYEGEDCLNPSQDATVITESHVLLTAESSDTEPAAYHVLGTSITLHVDETSQKLVPNNTVCLFALPGGTINSVWKNSVSNIDINTLSQNFILRWSVTLDTATSILLPWEAPMTANEPPTYDFLISAACDNLTVPPVYFQSKSFASPLDLSGVFGKDGG